MSYSQPTRETVKDKPWRYIGYRGFAEFTASDHDFFTLRRFDTLAARALLLRQWELVKVEKRLGALDFERSHGVERDFNNGSFECDDDERQDCIRRAEQHLQQYYELLNNYIPLRMKPQAASESVKSIQEWLRSWDDGTIAADESAFVHESSDLFALVDTPRTPLRRWLEKVDLFRDRRMFRRETPVRSEAGVDITENTVYQHDARLDSVTNAIVCIAGYSMLVAPLWILLYLPTATYQLAVITIFIALFLGIVQSVTIAKPFESLAATAAYSAVLMVFMQIGPHAS